MPDLETLDELLKSMSNRSPAAAGEVEQVIDEKSRPIDVVGDMGPKVKTYLPDPYPHLRPKDGAPTKTVSSDGSHLEGYVPPDFSGYDAIIKSMEAKQPKEPGLPEILTMLGTAGIGAAYGQLGAAAKPAGAWGLKQVDDHKKRKNALDDMLLKLQLDRAAKMAKGMKGTKVGGAGAGGWRARVWVDRDTGAQRWMTKQDESGNWTPSDDDIPISMPQVSFGDEKTFSGLNNQVAKQGNRAVQIGMEAPKMAKIKSAEDETLFANDRTGEIFEPGDRVNKTSMQLTKGDTADYTKLRDKANSDPLLRGLEGSYNDMSLGMTALGRGDIAGALAATKMGASALEKGRMTSDQDMKQVSSMNLGYANRMNQILQNAIEGGKITEDGRRELESLFSIIEANSRDAHARRLGRYNDEIQTSLGKDYRPELALKGLPKFTGKKQDQLVGTSIKTAKDTMSTGEFIDVYKDPQTGEPVVDAHGAPVKAVYIMRNGKPYAIRKAP